MSSTALIAVLPGLLVAGGIVAFVYGLNVPPKIKQKRSSGTLEKKWAALDRRTKTLIVVGLAAGALVAVATGWLIALVLVPAAVIGLPILLSPPTSAVSIERLNAVEEWTRALSGLLMTGGGLEQAIIGTLRSTPDAIRPEVTQLVSRLNARWNTEDALRAFADDLGDNVGGAGDMIAANLTLGARRRGGGLNRAMTALAGAVAEEVRDQRAIEADRAKPRTTARWVTIITIGVLAVLALTGNYIEPYRSPLGQILLTVLLSAYVGALLWMRNMTKGDRTPRFMGAEARRRGTA